MTPEEIAPKIAQLHSSQQIVQDLLKILTVRQAHMQAVIETVMNLQVEQTARDTGQPIEAIRAEFAALQRVNLLRIVRAMGIELEGESFAE